MPADSIVTVRPATLQIAGVVVANTTGLPEAPPLAETLKLPLGANTGAAGSAMNCWIVCRACPMAMFCVTAPAAA